MAGSNSTRGYYASSNGSSRRPVDSNRPVTWKCCNCGGGWFSVSIDNHCPMCHMARCNACLFASSAN